MSHKPIVCNNLFFLIRISWGFFIYLFYFVLFYFFDFLIEVGQSGFRLHWIVMGETNKKIEGANPTQAISLKYKMVTRF